jgi:hypothetical protein
MRRRCCYCCSGARALSLSLSLSLAKLRLRALTESRWIRANARRCAQVGTVRRSRFSAQFGPQQLEIQREFSVRSSRVPRPHAHTFGAEKVCPGVVECVPDAWVCVPFAARGGRRRRSTAGQEPAVATNNRTGIATTTVR